MKKSLIFLVLCLSFGFAFCHKTGNVHPNEENHFGIFCVSKESLLDLVELIQIHDFREAENKLVGHVQIGECEVTEKEGYAFLLEVFVVELFGLRQVELEVFRVQLSAPPFVLFFQNGQMRHFVLLEEVFLIKGAEKLIRIWAFKPADK